MKIFMVAGIGTEVGKTIVSAILAKRFGADYWKPIECGASSSSDTACVRQWLDEQCHTVHPPAYALKAPLSPHHAARLEKLVLDPDQLRLPKTTRPLVIEGVGGTLVPFTEHLLTIDLFTQWPCVWILVSRHYLGSINHTLLTIEALKQRTVELKGIIFNGDPNPDSESAIFHNGQVPCIARLRCETQITKTLIERYAEEWTFA